MTEHANIYAALLAAQPNFTKPKKTEENSHFKNKYAGLESVVDAVKPALLAEGIVFFQPTAPSEFGTSVKTILYHVDSTTQIETEVPLLMGKQDMQGLKSASTYARRIGLENLCGLAPADGDDDAETDRQGNSMGAALSDAWQQGVLDNLPENATPAQRAKAFADAICADFAGKGQKALQNRWNKHRSLIANLENRFPDLHSAVVDAYEIAVMEASGSYTSSQHAAE